MGAGHPAAAGRHRCQPAEVRGELSLLLLLPPPPPLLLLLLLLEVWLSALDDGSSTSLGLCSSRGVARQPSAALHV